MPLFLLTLVVLLTFQAHSYGANEIEKINSRSNLKQHFRSSNIIVDGLVDEERGTSFMKKLEENIPFVGKVKTKIKENPTVVEANAKLAKHETLKAWITVIKDQLIAIALIAAMAVSGGLIISAIIVLSTMSHPKSNMSSTKKLRKSSSSRRHNAPVNEWKQYISPDGHPYYYNAATKESRWEVPIENERPKGTKRTLALNIEQSSEHDEGVNQEASVTQEYSFKTQKEHLKSHKSAIGKTDASATPKPKNSMFQELQASLEGSLRESMMRALKPPAILETRQSQALETSPAIETQSLEEQYEAETIGMSAAERLRFLRKKRQENMISNRESLAGDDFMAEVANNLKKKGVIVKPKEKQRDDSEKGVDWEEQEQAEVQRKQQEMQKEMEEINEKERQQQQEQELSRQLELELQHEQEKKKMRRKRKKRVEKEVEKEDAGRDFDSNNAKSSLEHNASITVDMPIVSVGDDQVFSSSESIEHRSRHKNSRNSLTQLDGRNEIRQTNSSEDTVEGEHSEYLDLALVQKVNERADHQDHKKREKNVVTEVNGATVQSKVASEPSRRRSESRSQTRTRSSSSVKEEDARAKETHLRRERRRMAKMEAAFSVHNLESTNGEQPSDKISKQDVAGSTNLAPSSDYAAWYFKNSQPVGQPVLGQPVPGQLLSNSGMYSQYPYVMMLPQPPSLHGHYHPFVPPPIMPMPVYGYGMIPSETQSISPITPSSTNGTMALVSYGADYEGSFSQQIAPELTKCECCKGVGVGLVERNGVCAHCNRLRLAFIIDSAQMRQRCSVCGGWGFQLLQANGMCAHCTRQKAKKTQAKLDINAAAPHFHIATTGQKTLVNSSKTHILDDVEWDNSSDESDWDE
ncbi:putative WW domain-containing protein [Plasmopara halstedii]